MANQPLESSVLVSVRGRWDSSSWITPWLLFSRLLYLKFQLTDGRGVAMERFPPAVPEGRSPRGSLCVV